VEITPERVAIINLQDCAEQLERSAAEPIRMALAAKAAHLAIQPALAAALAGSADGEAHPQKLKEKWLSYLGDRGTEGVERPGSDRLMTFANLLRQALATPLPWIGTRGPCRLCRSAGRGEVCEACKYWFSHLQVVPNGRRMSFAHRHANSRNELFAST
jgi:hypothetical protein